MNQAIVKPGVQSNRAKRQRLFGLLALSAVLLMAGCDQDGRTPRNAPKHAPTTRAPIARPVDLPPMPVAPAATAKEVRVALLMPLTGENATLGNALLDAAMLGLFDKYNSMPANQQPTKLILLPKDTEGTVKGAAIAANSALQEGARLFIGPLLTEEVKAVTPIAKKAGVPILSLSNNPQVAGNSVHLFGFLADEQVRRVVDQAFQRDLIKIGALVPANEYGQLVANALREAAIRSNHPLVGIEFYPPGGQDVDLEVQKLLRSGPNGSRPELDALLIAEGGDKLNHIISRLEVFGVSNKNTQLLGTGLWDDAAVLANPKLSGGWFAGAPLVSSSNFDKRYTAQYGQHAPRLASLAYDAVALAVTLSVMTPDKTFPEALLTNPHGYIGPANGIFRLRDNGLIQRGLGVIEITPKGLRELSPAPRAFYGSN